MARPIRFPHSNRAVDSASASSNSSFSPAEFARLIDENHRLKAELAETRVILKAQMEHKSKPAEAEASAPVSIESHSSQELNSPSSGSELLSANYSLSRVIDGLRAELSSLNASLVASVGQNQILQTAKAALETRSVKLKSELAELSSAFDSLKLSSASQSADRVDLLGQLSSSQSKLKLLESEFSSLNSVNSSSARDSFERAELQAALMNSANQHSRQLQGLQNELQAARQFIEEIKNEFESAAANWKSKLESERNDGRKEAEKLRKLLGDQLDQSHREAVEIASEQNQILSALQAQFDDYRSAAEELFAAEANSLKSKLGRQQKKFDDEIRLLNRTKEEQMSRLVLSKDSKILALIEGTEMQKILLQQQNEIESISKMHQKQLETVRVESQSEFRAAIEQLRAELELKKLEIHKFQSTISQWEQKMDQTISLVKKQKKLHLIKEEQNELAQRELLTQITNSHRTIEELIKIKENLRHRILRLRLKLDGGDSESVQSNIKKLTKDAANLNAQTEIMKFQLAEQRNSLARKDETLQAANNQIERMKNQLAAEEQNQQKLVKTFESFLSGRIRGIAGTKRNTLVTGQAKQIIEFIGQLAEKTIRRESVEPQQKVSAEPNRRGIIWNAAEDQPINPTNISSDLSFSFDGGAAASLNRGFEAIKLFKKENQRIKELFKFGGKSNKAGQTTAAEADAAAAESAQQVRREENKSNLFERTELKPVYYDQINVYSADQTTIRVNQNLEQRTE